MNSDVDIFERISKRRQRVADLVETLTPEQLATPSLCAGWDVRTVVGHLATPLVHNRTGIVLATLRRGGNFHRANDDLARQVATKPVPELSGVLRRHAASRFTPPLHGPAAPFDDLCVHSADIRVPLGMGHDITPEEAEIGIDLLTSFPMFIIPWRRLRGIAIVPDDLDRQWGKGLAIRGNAAELLLAMTGRHPFIGGVAGPGKDLLVQRT